MEPAKIRLSAKEQLILRLISEGKTNPQIAEELCLSLPTIKWYRKRIRTKFDVSTTVEVIRKALEQEIL
jgi:DNA-binding CsgD family transcriptional regulator